MKIKRLFRRAGGIITAFALLASMMVMAGAAPDGNYICGICGLNFGYGVGLGKTYQEYYATGDIPNLTDFGGIYWSNSALSIAAYNGNHICESCLEAKIAEYKANLRRHPKYCVNLCEGVK